MSNQRKIKELVEFVQTIDKLNWLLISENDKNKFRTWNSSISEYVLMNSQQQDAFDGLTNSLHIKMVYIKSKQHNDNSPSLLNILGMKKIKKVA